MGGLGRAGLAVAVLTALCAAAAPAVAQTETIVADPSADAPSALRGVQVWLRDDKLESRRDELDIVSDRLVQRVGGRVSDAPVRDGVGEPDLGTDAADRLVAVYRRCTGSHRRKTFDCDVYSYRPGTTRRERRVRYASSARCHESAPSIWRGLVVVMRVKRRSGCAQGLFAVRPSGKAKRLSRRVPDQRPERSEDDVVITDVHGRRVLLFFSHTEVEATGYGIDSDVTLLRTSGGRGRSLASASLTETDSDEFATGSVLTEAMLDGGHAYWLQSCLGADPETGEQSRTTQVVGRPVSDGPPGATAALDGAVSGFAVDGEDVFLAGAGLLRSSDLFQASPGC